ncbi:MAG TPA: CotH kinase family protein [Polyangiaceae bacterium]|nr:CotH kinase family protein [Polyangiaceae bacterium]
MSAARRIYRMRPLTALVLCLPALLIMLWYSWNAHERFAVARRIERERVPLTLELFQLHLYDLLSRDARRMKLEAPPAQSSLETFAFQIDREGLDILESGGKRSSGRAYAPAKLEYQGQLEKVELRLRGQRYWHMGTEQKSLKVRLPKGRLVRGHRVFNLINDPSPLVIGEQVILDLAREHGILTPLSSFARVRMNQTDLGVFRYETQPDESMLRTSNRVPGSIYSGDLSSDGDSWELWASPAAWKKPAATSDAAATVADFSELERLLAMVRESTHANFADFARHELDLERFAAFDAIDVAFGGNRHNFRQNQKYAFDAFRGLWEPIAWSFEGFRDDPNFDPVEHPLLIRLKMVPGYLALRDRLLYEFLTGDGSYTAVKRRGLGELEKLAPELNTDPFWDAYHLMNRVDGFHRQLVRPMNMARAVLVFESEMTTYRQRTERLLAELTTNPLYVGWHLPVGTESKRSPGFEPPFRTRLELFIRGRVGVDLSHIAVQVHETCRSKPARLYQGERVLVESARTDSLKLERPLRLLPGVRLTAVPEPGGTDGTVRTEPTVELFELELETECSPRHLEVTGTQLATGRPVVARPAPVMLRREVPRARRAADERVRFEPGEVAPHPWKLAPPEPQTIELGPGLVEVAATRVFGAHQEVKVRAGTRFAMGAKASLIFLGKVQFLGTQAEPIVIERQGTEFWGGVALLGRASQGSRLQHVQASGGSSARYRLASLPAMLNIHDTSDIGLAHCRFRQNAGPGDVVHVAYVDKLLVTDSEVRDATEDAWDLEFTRGKLERVRVTNAGDDALDLMGSDLEIADSVLIGAKGNAISAGESTTAKLRDSLIGRASVAILAKNASRVDLSGTLLFKNATGVRIYERTVRYAGPSAVSANLSFAALTGKKLVDRSDREHERLDFGTLRAGLPTPGPFDGMLHDLLGLASWNDLDAWVTREQSGDVL